MPLYFPLAGKAPREAFDAFVSPLQRALSCISDAVFVRSYGSATPGGIRSIIAPTAGRFVPLRGENRLHFSAALQYEIVKTDDPDRGPWKVSTKKYMYHVVTGDMTEVILFHWHPEVPPGPQRGPHLHFGSSQLTRSAVVSHRTHVPTGRVSLESVIELLITDFNVVPRRADWKETLDESRQRFHDWRTWS